MEPNHSNGAIPKVCKEGCSFLMLQHWGRWAVVGNEPHLRNSMGVIRGYGYPVPTFFNPSPYPCGFHTAGIRYPWMKPTGTQVLINPQVPVGFSCRGALHACTIVSFMHMRLPPCGHLRLTHMWPPLIYAHIATSLTHAPPPSSRMSHAWLPPSHCLHHCGLGPRTTHPSAHPSCHLHPPFRLDSYHM